MSPFPNLEPDPVSEKKADLESNSSRSRNRLEETTSQCYGDADEEGLSRYSSKATGTSIRPAATRRETLVSRIRSRQAIGSFTHPLSHIKTTVEDLVDFDSDDDPYRPVNWPFKKKAITTVLYGLTTMTSTWASSAFSPGTKQVAQQYGVAEEVATLGTALFLFAFGIGPLLFAPLSEVFGRKNSVLPPVFVAACFSFATGASKDLQSICITRFFAGFFGSAPVTNTGGVLADLYPPNQRGIALASYAMAVVWGPCVGPLVSAALIDATGTWRWTQYFTGILQLSILLVDIVFIDESYPPALLVYKSRRLRHETGNWALHAKFEEWDVSIRELASKFLVRPFQLLVTPICGLMAFYASLCYGLLYMQLGAIPIIFTELRGWPLVSGELPFLAIMLGAIIGAGVNIYNQTVYNVKWEQAGRRPVPEARLPPMMAGAFFFCAGQFLYGWTAAPHYPWIAPVVGLTLFGLGFFMIFQAALNYLVDTFQRYSASAIATNTFLRSCFAGALPLVVTYMYRNLGVGVAASVTGAISALLIPVPFVFFVYGKRIRALSKWSQDSVY